MKKWLAVIITFVFVAGFVFILLSPDKLQVNKLEIFSWWTAIGEEEALQELYNLYKEKNPEVNIINATVVGGAGFNARGVLETRMEGGNPPDTFQAHAGPNLMNTWIKPGYLEDLSSIYEEYNLYEQLPQVITNKLKFRGGIYAIPINIHRDNVLWYNVQIFERYNITPPKSVDELYKAIEKLAENGITPFALGNKNQWPASHLFETILVAHLGAERYSGMWDGETNWDSQKIRKALREFLHLLDYSNSDHAALTWDEAVQYMIDGKCAMTVMGDFTEGYLKAKGLRPKRQFGWVPYPGTEDVFVMNSDTFSLPKGAAHRSNAVKWLELIASKKGQDAFNPKKGSIPARRDSREEIEEYDSYQKSALEAFREKKKVSSFTHGAVASDEWRSRLNTIIDNFIVTQEVPEALDKMRDASGRFLNQ